MIRYELLIRRELTALIVGVIVFYVFVFLCHQYDNSVYDITPLVPL